MNVPIQLVRFASATIARRLLFATYVVMAAQLTASAQATHAHQQSPAKLVQIVRQATQQFLDVNNASAAGYAPFLGCVSGPDHGAMGIHYLNGALVGDGEIDATHPEALIYEPGSDGQLRLVGVEYIVIASQWLANHSSPPVLEGQSFQFIESPNRYNVPGIFELHVWAWRPNPAGAFVDWNNHVSCESE